MISAALLALAASASTVVAQSAKGFNLASNGNDQSAFDANFKSASSLPGASGFDSVRLYTMIQDGTADTPISAIPAAIESKGTLLLGLWASAGQAAFDNEITALKSAISQYGQSFADAVVGISVGSEDLYRITYTSQVVNKDPNPGAEPDTLVSYIKQVKAAIKGTVLANKLVGHVDTYTAFVNGSNSAVIDAADFLGMDAYPYYQTTVSNSIDDAYDLFFSAYDQTVAAAGGKPVWVTETGWPYTGPTSHLAVASIKNAETYWKKVGCALFGKTNVWWYTLADGGSNPAFGIRGTSIDNKPLFDLSCSSSSSSSSSASKTASSTGSKSSVASATAPGSSKSVSTTGVPTPIPSGGESVSSGTATATPKGPGSSGSSGAAPYPTGTTMTTAAAGTGAVGTGSSGAGATGTSSASPSGFSGAANRANAEMGAGFAAMLGLVALL